jgi:hypothetical protein
VSCHHFGGPSLLTVVVLLLKQFVQFVFILLSLDTGLTQASKEAYIIAIAGVGSILFIIIIFILFFLLLLLL